MPIERHNDTDGAIGGAGRRGEDGASRLSLQRIDQATDRSDRSKVRRCDAGFGDLEAELLFDGQHEAHHVQRAQSRLAKILVRTNAPIDRMLGEQALNKTRDSLLDGRRVRVGH